MHYMLCTLDSFWQKLEAFPVKNPAIHGSLVTMSTDQRNHTVILVKERASLWVDSSMEAVRLRSARFVKQKKKDE